MKTSKKQKAILCAMAVTALLSQSSALTYAASQEEFGLDQVVVTANRMPTKVSETAANVTVVTKEQIEKNHYLNLGEVLQQVTGVVVTAQGHPGAGQYVRLNADDRVLIMIDGRRMNMDKGAAAGRAGYDLNSLPTLANVERIEIVKGASSALYGSDAVGGVVNIITRKGTENSTEFDMSTGAWGKNNYQLSHQGQDQSWRWFVTAGKSKQDHFEFKDFKTGEVKTMDNSFYDKNSATIRIDKEIDEKHSLTLNFEHMGDESGQPYMAPGYKQPDTKWGPGASNHYPNDYKTDVDNNWALTYNFNNGLETAGYFRVYENYHASQFNQLRSGKWSASSYNNKARGAEWQNGWRLDDHNLVVAGAEWRDTKVENVSKYQDKGITTKALFLEDQISLDDKWTLTPGLRYDNHNMFGSKMTPKAAVNYKIDDNTNMYVSWGKVFNAPNADDLFWPDSGYTAGNPNLKPETGSTTSVGINKKIGDNTTVKASYFYNELKDAINWAPDSAGKWMPSNVDEQRKKGFEIELKKVLSPQWSIETAYTYLNVEAKSYPATSYTVDEKNSQPNAYRIAVNYTQDAWAVGLTARHASGRSLKNFSASSYWVLDTAVNYKFNDNATGYLKVNNLTNQAYEINGNPASSGGVGGFPMPGRNVQFGVQYKL